jgi:hypothetical protein
MKMKKFSLVLAIALAFSAISTGASAQDCGVLGCGWDN